MALTQWSETNILNSVALYITSQFIAQGYVIYYHRQDAMQINTSATGWYYQWSTNKAAILADSAFAAALSAGKGLLTVVEALPAEPRFVERLISDASVGAADEVPVPALAFSLTSEQFQDGYELGTKMKWRSRHLMVDSYTRDDREQGRIKDWLTWWLELNSIVDIADHDAGSQAAVGSVVVDQVRVDTDRFFEKGQAATYQVLANALLTYVA